MSATCSVPPPLHDPPRPTSVLPAPGDNDELKALAHAAGAGDALAMSELMRRTSPMIRRLCSTLVDPGSADDLTQDTLVRVLRSLSSYRGDSDPRRWLGTVARRVCAEEIARRQRQRQLMSSVAHAEQRRHRHLGEDSMAEVHLGDALSRLHHERRQALILTAIQGMSYADVAVLSGCPVGTVRSRVARARADLASAI